MQSGKQNLGNNQKLFCAKGSNSGGEVIVSVHCVWRLFPRIVKNSIHDWE